MYDYTILVFVSWKTKNVAACDWVRNLFATFCPKLQSKIVEIVSVLQKIKHYVKK